MPQDGDYTYTESGGNATITAYTGAGGDISIPSTVGGYPVVAIYQLAFYNIETITSLIIPDSVITLGANCFASMDQLASVAIGSGVTTLGNSVFENCPLLTSVTLPNNITTLGIGIFYNCTGLTSVIFGSGITGIPQNTCRYCSSLATVTLRGGVTTIGAYAFSGWGPSCEIYFHGLVAPTAFGTNWSTALSEGHAYAASNFPAPAAYLDNVLLMGDNIPPPPETLWTYTIADGKVTVTGYLGTDMAPTVPSTLEGLPVVAIGADCFNSADITAVSIPDSVETIGDRAFYMCSSLASVTMGSGVTSIGMGAFYWDEALTSIALPDSLTTIGVSAFRGCTLLASVTLGSGLATLADSSFSECPAMAAIAIPASVMTIGANVFDSCSSLASISFLGLIAPTSVGADWILGTDAGIVGHAYAASDFPPPGSYWNSLLMGFVLPSTDWTYSIDDGEATVTGYLGAGGAVVIPTSFEDCPTVAIGAGCFWHNATITSLIIPETVTSIANSGCRHMTALTSIVIPDAVTSLGYCAFDTCTSLTSVIMGKGIHSIDSYVFASGSVLSSITFRGLEAPTGYVSSTWVYDHASALRGHASLASDFPPPGEYWNGLLMGDVTLDTAIMLNGEEITALVSIDGLTATRRIGMRGTASFRCIDKTGVFRPLVGQEVMIVLKGVVVFVGTVDEVDESTIRGTPDSGLGVEYGIACVDFAQACDRKLVAPITYTDTPSGTVIANIITTYLATEGISNDGVVLGPNITLVIDSHKTCADIFKTICEMTDYDWWVDDGRVFHYESRDTTAAPYDISSDSGDRLYRNLSIKTNRTDYWNSQRLLLTKLKDLHPAFVGTAYGDGTARQFDNFGGGLYLIDSITTLLLNAVPQTFGVLGVDTGKDWYYTPGGNTLFQDVGGTTLTASDFLYWTYVVRYPISIAAEDSTEIAARAAIEGGSGIYENVSETTQMDIAAASAEMYGLLESHKHLPIEVSYDVDSWGPDLCQYQYVTSAKHGIASERCYVNEVSTTVRGGRASHHIVLSNRKPPEPWELYFTRPR